jgi:hypothetical protein
MNQRMKATTYVCDAPLSAAMSVTVAVMMWRSSAVSDASSAESRSTMEWDDGLLRPDDDASTSLLLADCSAEVACSLARSVMEEYLREAKTTAAAAGEVVTTCPDTHARTHDTYFTRARNHTHRNRHTVGKHEAHHISTHAT